jgi:DMSO/TMAO reductase YedYZ molybdopterin-dependent catalytic subunit
MSFTRREILSGLGIPLVASAADSIQFADYESGFRTDVQETRPHVKVFDLRRLTDWQTPAEDFFTFHQTKSVLGIDLNEWRLAVAGCVARPRSFTYAELAGFPPKHVAAAIECAGNTGHARIMNGLVSNGVWTGPLLGPLLRECGVLPEAREVVFFGADVEREKKWPAGDREYAAPHGRSIFVQDAVRDGPILAMQLNGKPLPADHGYPIRLLLPGWYGMTQVKWLNRIVVLDRRYEGRHMARNYHSIRRESGDLVLETSISRNRLKSVTARVEGKGRILGAAWGGSEPIERVEVRIDDGPWRPAEFTRRSDPQAWSLWKYDWAGATPGTHTIVSRAVDSRGNMQPEQSQFVSAREENAQWMRRVTVS